MSDWLEDPKPDNNNNTENHTEPVDAGGDVTPSFSPSGEGETPKQEVPPEDFRSPIPPIPPVSPMQGGYTNGWQSADGYSPYNGSAYTPSGQRGGQPDSQQGYPASGQSYPSGGQQGGNPYQTGSYQPQGGYDPYGWQSPQPPVAGPGQQPPKPPKKKKSGAGILIGILGVVCAGTIITLSVLLALAVSDKSRPQVDSSSQSTTSRPEGGGNYNPDREVNENAPTLNITEPAEDAEGLTTREIVKKTVDSTVVLTMYQQTGGYLGESDYQAVGGASGIVMTEDGYIITNRHCVINEQSTTEVPYDRIDVTTYDGTVYEDAQIIGSDSFTDLAVIKINASGLKPAEFGDSSQVYLGDRVVAIGNAGGLQWTVTQGILSGQARDVYQNSDYAIKCLQVDAAINPGNSGGPLFNSLGQVIGINSAKLVKEEYEGLGFAIPINEAKPVIDDLLKYGYVKGRIMLSITGKAFAKEGYESGIQIYSINSDSVLSGTQAKVGDVITYIDGQRVKTVSDISSVLSSHEVGDEIEIRLNRLDTRNRKETEIVIRVTLKEYQGT